MLWAWSPWWWLRGKAERQPNMEFPYRLEKAAFISRPNRFATWAKLGREQVYCHMPNPGRMHELLHPGVELWIADKRGDNRVTTHDVVLVRQPDSLVCLDSRLPPALAIEAWREGLMPEFGDCTQVRQEVTYGSSRLDLRLECAGGTWLVETKSCTLVMDDRVARFPDAPTLRGARHMRELVAALGEGYRAAAVLVIQRSDPVVFAPNRETDPEFAQALSDAARAGVEILAVKCEVTPQGVWPTTRLDVDLDR